MICPIIAKDLLIGTKYLPGGVSGIVRNRWCWAEDHHLVLKVAEPDSFSHEFKIGFHSGASSECHHLCQAHDNLTHVQRPSKRSDKY